MNPQKTNHHSPSARVEGKLPPQAIDIEETVLGMLMLDSRAIHEVIGELSDDVFYKESHQAIFRAIVSLYDSNEPIDIITVSNKLREHGTLEMVGGPYRITQLTSRIASSNNISFHVKILTQKYISRKVIQVCNDTIVRAYDDQEDPFDVLDFLDAETAKVGEISVRGGSLNHISESVHDAVEEAMKRELMTKEGKASGITTGIHDLDKLTGGWQNSDLIILAARPGMGKTALMLHFAKSAASSGTPVCIYSLEMSAVSLTNRMLLSVCNADPDRFKKGYMTKEDWNEINKAVGILNKLPIYIDPNPVVSMRYIKSNSRVKHRKGQCGMIMIDYLQLADVSTDSKNRNREQEISQASRQAKIIAKELNVPVMLLSQLNRKAEDRKGNVPMLSDLRESGAIEQDADIVAFVYRPEYYNIETDDMGRSTKGAGMVKLDKHRNGATDDAWFRYNETLTKIYDYDEVFDSHSVLTPNTSFESTPF